MQDRTYVCEEIRLPVDDEPVTPVKPPGETEQLVVLTDVHESIAAVLNGIVIGPSLPFAFISADGETQLAKTVTSFENSLSKLPHDNDHLPRTLYLYVSPGVRVKSVVESAVTVSHILTLSHPNAGQLAPVHLYTS